MLEVNTHNSKVILESLWKPKFKNLQVIQKPQHKIQTLKTYVQKQFHSQATHKNLCFWKQWSLQNLSCTHILAHMFTCVGDVWKQNPIYKNIGSFMQKHKHGTKLISLLKLVQIPIWSLVILLSLPINPC
jgi:hypothetical protein